MYQFKLFWDNNNVNYSNDLTVSYITYNEYKSLSSFIYTIGQNPIAKANYLITRNEIEPYILNNLTNWLYNPSFFLDVKNNINNFLKVKFDVYFDGLNIIFNNDNNPLYVPNTNELTGYITNEFTFNENTNEVYRSINSYNKINTQINNWINKIDKNQHYYIHCAAGYRSIIATSFLQSKGFRNFTDVKGGINAVKSLLNPSY